MLELKHIFGHEFATRMDWLCIKNVNEKFGFGDSPAIVCVDMTVHEPQYNRPNVVFSTYENPEVTAEQVGSHFMPIARHTWEQVAFAKRIITGWDRIKSGDTIEIVQDDYGHWNWERQ